jgi:uncharacterized protein YdeI (BOF family)
MTRQASLAAAAAAFAMIATPALADRGRSDAAASDTSASSMQAPAGAGPKAEKKTCRRFANTVSRMKSIELCLTREGWQKFEDQQQQQ